MQTSADYPSPHLRFNRSATLNVHESINLFRGSLSDNGISNSEAADMLSSDLQSAIVQAQAQPWWPNVQDSDARARAFCEIVFNMGIGSLATFREALDAAMRSDWDACAEQFLASVWASEVGERANFLAEMIRTDQDATP
jgi:lysozyme